MSGKQYPRLMAREKFATPSDQARTGHPTSRMGEHPMPDDQSTSKADDAKKDDPPKDDAKKDDAAKDDARKGSDTAKKSDDADGDDTDWKKESRKHEGRAKAAKEAADKAAEDKAAADERAEAAESKNAEILDVIAKGLGIKKDDAPPDPAKLADALKDRDRDLKAKDDVIAARDQEIAELKAERDSSVAAKDVELAAWREATKQGVNAAMLLNLRSTERALAALDHGADDFADKLAELIKNEAKDNPALLIKAASTAADAGLGGATGSGDTASSAAPGLGRLKAAYATTP